MGFDNRSTIRISITRLKHVVAGEQEDGVLTINHKNLDYEIETER